MPDPVNHPDHYRAKSRKASMPWASRSVADKPCKECGEAFRPFCGGSLYCDTCQPAVRRRKHAEGQRNWRKQNPQRHALSKAGHDLKKFNMSVDDYFNRLAEQGGRCAICRTDQPGGRGITRPLAVDHCHSSGRVRKLLCHRCNGALGMVSDSPEILARMIEYVKEHSGE